MTYTQLKKRPPLHPLQALRSVGPATVQDFVLLGINTPEELATADPRELYDRLCELEKQVIDICQYDVFCCAVAQARDPYLPDEQKEWAWWSRERKRLALTKTQKGATRTSLRTFYT